MGGADFGLLSQSLFSLTIWNNLKFLWDFISFLHEAALNESSYQPA